MLYKCRKNNLSNVLLLQKYMIIPESESVNRMYKLLQNRSESLSE